MNIKLAAVTTPIPGALENVTLPDEIISYCARVSNPSNQSNVDTADKLIAYLIRKKHWSPFEMVNVVVEITTTRDIARQILRHRSFSFQEFSQRYADPTKELGFVICEARLQDANNRQNSIEVDDLGLQAEWVRHQEELLELVKEKYNWAISRGIAKEVARKVLPEGLTESRLYMNGTVRSWIHYLEQRTDIATQKEHREVAVAIAQAITKIFPVIGTVAKAV